MGRAIFGVMVSVAALATAIDASASPCELRLLASVPAHADQSAGLVVQASINQVPVRMVIDTGVGYSALTRPFVVRENLPIGSAHLDFRAGSRWPLSHALDRSSNNAAGNEGPGDRMDENVSIDQLTLGAAHSNAEQLAVLPRGSDGTDNRPVGVVGANYLATHDIEFDATDGKVNLFEPLTCAEAPVYWSSEYGSIPIHFDDRSGLITVSAILDGVPVNALVDTGSGITAMSLATARRKFGVADNPASLEMMADRTGVDGVTVKSYRARFHQLVIGSMTVRNPTIALEILKSSEEWQTGSHINAHDTPDIVIGIDLFKQLRTIIAYADGHIYYTKAEPALL